MVKLEKSFLAVSSLLMLVGFAYYCEAKINQFVVKKLIYNFPPSFVLLFSTVLVSKKYFSSLAF